MTKAKYELRIADDKELYRFFGVRLERTYNAVCGRDGIRTIGIGGIYQDLDGQVWGFIDARPEYFSPVMYRQALRFLRSLAQDGVKSIKVQRQNIDTSEAFLTRLGFKKTAEVINDMEIWEWQQ